MIGVYTLVSVQGSKAVNHGKLFVVTKVSTLLIITQVTSVFFFLEMHMFIFSKYKYLHVKIASLANVKSCVPVGPIH